ncbi:MAG TPA: NAD-dependent epimerase/dehydratase family protein [Patescibacteria group bacterium]|nr:NAD-dependent epimerase/dehydratase family protein [Patescibacteria group bacterium]
MTPDATGRGKVLVTGATGFLGAALIQRLLGDGARVRALARSAASASPLAELGAEVVLGDVTDRRAVSEALDGVEVVYHLAGRLLVPGVPAAEYRRTHVAGTELMLECCAEMPSVRRFVHCSTTGVLGVTGPTPADESAAFRPTNVYEATKAEAEMAVRRAVQSGFPAVIVRPGLVYGPGDLHLLGFFRSVLRRQFRPIGRQAVWLHPIYIDDMSEALVRCGEHPAAVGECFHIAGTQTVSLAERGAEIARAEGTHLPGGRIPWAPAYAAALVGDCLPARLKRYAPLTRTRLDFLTHSRVYDVAKAKRLLGFVASTDLATGIARTTEWYRQQHLLPLGVAA